MRPDLDEIPSTTGSPTGLAFVEATERNEQRSDLIWLYTNPHTDNHCSEEDTPPLKIRRPALYDEYWTS